MPAKLVAVLRQVAYAVVLTATLTSHNVYAAPESFSPVMPVNACPGETMSFTCTVTDSSVSSITVWTGTAFDNFDCDLNVIVLLHEEFQNGAVDMCSDGEVVAHATGVSGDCYTSNLTVVLSPQLNGTTIECQHVVTTIGSPYTLTVAGPPTAPTMLGIDFTLPGRQFAVQWDSTSVVSEANITGFLLSIQSPGGLTCDDTSSISDATESLCSWDESAVGQTHNFSVSALICGGTQEGAWSDSVSITLQSQDCPASELGEVDTDLNPNCPGDSVGSVHISAGRACYAGTAPGSTAEYDCSCPQYRLEGNRTRICQGDGAWSGAVPQCLPQCNLVPDPTNHVTHFVAQDCSPDTSTVNATYSCGLNKDNSVIQFSTPMDGNCQWPEPPCEVSEAVAGIVGPALYGFMTVAIFCLAVRILTTKVEVKKHLIATTLAMCLILPPVGIVLAWWLTYSKQAPSTSNRTFVWTWCKVAMAVGGGILWFVNLITWIVLAVFFGPPDALPSNSAYGLLIFGLCLAIVTLVYCLAMVAMGLGGVPTRKKAWQQEDGEMSMKEKASLGPVSRLGFKSPVVVPEDTTAQKLKELLGD